MCKDYCWIIALRTGCTCHLFSWPQILQMQRLRPWRHCGRALIPNATDHDLSFQQRPTQPTCHHYRSNLLQQNADMIGLHEPGQTALQHINSPCTRAKLQEHVGKWHSNKSQMVPGSCCLVVLLLQFPASSMLKFDPQRPVQWPGFGFLSTVSILRQRPGETSIMRGNSAPQGHCP